MHMFTVTQLRNILEFALFLIFYHREGRGTMTNHEAFTCPVTEIPFRGR